MCKKLEKRDECIQRLGAEKKNRCKIQLGKSGCRWKDDGLMVIREEGRLYVVMIHVV